MDGKQVIRNYYMFINSINIIVEVPPHNPHTDIVMMQPSICSLVPHGMGFKNEKLADWHWS